jgi:hypothetical protein
MRGESLVLSNNSLADIGLIGAGSRDPKRRRSPRLYFPSQRLKNLIEVVALKLQTYDSRDVAEHLNSLLGYQDAALATVLPQEEAKFVNHVLPCPQISGHLFVILGHHDNGKAAVRWPVPASPQL